MGTYSTPATKYFGAENTTVEGGDRGGVGTSYARAGTTSRFNTRGSSKGNNKGQPSLGELLTATRRPVDMTHFHATKRRRTLRACTVVMITYKHGLAKSQSEEEALLGRCFLVAGQPAPSFMLEVMEFMSSMHGGK